MNIPPAVADHFCLNLPTAFTQLRASTYCVKNIRYCRQKSAEETKYQIQSSKYMLHQGPRAVHAMRAREREQSYACLHHTRNHLAQMERQSTTTKHPPSH